MMENSHKLILNVDINEDLLDITSSLVMEYMNLLMYFRGQVPSPAQILKRQTKDGSLQMNDKNMRTNRKDNINQQKCQQCLKQLDEIKGHVKKSLKFCNKFEAVLLMGATPVSVKEVYSIKVCPPEDFVSWSQQPPTAAKLQYYKNKLNILLLQASSSFKKEIRCTKNMLLVKGVRKLAAESLRPWENFRFPKKRHMMHVDIELRAPPNHPLQSPPSAARMHVHQGSTTKMRRRYSAAEAAEMIFQTCSDSSNPKVNNQNIPVPPNNSQQLSYRRHSLPACLSFGQRRDVVDSDNDVTCPDDEIIWFEIPVSVKGFKF